MKAIAEPTGRARALRGLRSRDFRLVPVGYAFAALLAGMFAPSSLLIVGFSLSAVLWTAPLALRRVREAA
jgi:hypothetical protein